MTAGFVVPSLVLAAAALTGLHALLTDLYDEWKDNR